MRTHAHGSSSTLEHGLERWQRSADPQIVGDASVVERNVQIRADE